MDDDRLAMTLSRNGRFCDIDAFSRQDIALCPVDRNDPASVDRARAQLLNGAAAFVLSKMSEVYPSLRDGLCGASRWRSIALQVIATSASLSGNMEDPVALLRLATNMDPDNLRARHEYIRALTLKYKRTPFDVATANRLDELYALLVKQDPLRHKALALLILYDSAVDWFDIADRRQDPERTQYLRPVSEV